MKEVVERPTRREKMDDVERRGLSRRVTKNAGRFGLDVVVCNVRCADRAVGRC